MILHDAVKKLEEEIASIGCADGDLRYCVKPDCARCQFSCGECMSVEFGGVAAEVSTSVPFSACMKLENIFGAPLKSAKTRGAAAGALTAAAGFLMLTRKTGACDSLFREDCHDELVQYCGSRAVYVLGRDIAGLNQALTLDEAELVLITGGALVDEDLLEEIDEAERAGKEMLFLGPECAGVAALLQKKMWCPYGT